MTNETRAEAITALRAHLKSGAPKDMRKAFEDKSRFKKLSASFDDLLLDFSKSAVNTETMKLLVNLANACDLKKKREAMFAGSAINNTEGRAVLHTALRNRSGRAACTRG